MAIDYSINPYAGGAVLFDQRPSLLFAQNQQARQQAKDAALDNYFRDLNKNVTPAGMRSQDVPSLLEKQKEWQQFYQQNKSQIINPKLDNGKAYTEYFARYQDQLGHIQGSKEAMKATDQVGKMRMNPQLSYVFDDPKIIDQIQSHEKPINDPTRQGINLATMPVPPKPWGIKETDQYSKYLTQGLTPDEVMGKTENLPGFKTRTEILKQYSPENKKVIGQRAMNAYDSERELRVRAKHLTDELAADPNRYEQLNNVYKGVYGKDIEAPREALAAQAMFDEDRRSKSYKEGTDEWGRDNAMRKLKLADAKELIEYKKKIDPNDTEMNNTWIDNYYSRRIQDARNGRPTTFQDPNNPLTMKVGYEMKIDPIAAKAFEREGHQPETWYVTADNKILPIYYEYQETFDKNGKKTGASVKLDNNGDPVIDKDYSKPVDLDQAYLTMGYKGQSKKELGGTMQGAYKGNNVAPDKQSTQKSFTIDGKKVTRDELRKSYSDADIDEYIKLGIIK